MSWEHALGWFFAVVLGGLSLGFFAEAWGKYRLSARGLWVEAEIVRVDEDKDTDGDPRFHPVVAFTPPGGEPVEVKSPSGKPYPPEWGTGVGSKVSVRYDPARPTRMELPGYAGDGILTSLLVGLALAGTAGAIAVGMLG
ncbi:DUF3592 domain-containing protein [Streptomyces fuscichromogenes]|uniref:DUF3592 domain-containing protein n=1 Tax=Streptomyces fuscichromogenes TaxID=1324013 RepID=UPI003827679B